MRLRMLMLVVVAVCFIGSPALYADYGSCADCIKAGTKDSGGNISKSEVCDWGGISYGSCYISDATNKCVTHTASYCFFPDQGGYYSGGGSFGSGGSNCSSKFYCPPECMACGGSGGALY